MITFHPNIRNLMVGRGLLSGFSSPCAISVYSGAQPTSAEITANWSTYASGTANFLAHFVGGAWTQPAGGILLQLTVPPASTALQTGTGTWCILWSTNVSAAAVALTTLPSTAFIVGPVSVGIGPGVVRFNNPALVVSTSVTILDGSIGASAF